MAGSQARITTSRLVTIQLISASDDVEARDSSETAHSDNERNLLSWLVPVNPNDTQRPPGKALPQK